MRKVNEFLFLLPPFLLVLISVFSAAHENHSHVSVAELASLSFFLLAGFAVFYLLALLATKERAAAVKALTYFAIVWVLFGFMYDIGRTYFPGRYNNPLTILGLFIAVCGLLMRFKKRLPFSRNLQKAFLVFCLITIGLQLPSLLKIRSGSPVVYDGIEQALAGKAPSDKPHIVYIVPDRYASNHILRALYGFDNSAFTRELEKRGFYVWDGQYANYPKTFLSMASTLNMTYLDGVAEAAGPEETSYIPAYGLVKKNQVTRILKEHGYRYAHMGNWWEPTRKGRGADYEVTYGKAANEFTTKYIMTTPVLLLNIFLKSTGGIPELCALTERQAAAITDIAADAEEPVFFLWHLFTPHHPYHWDEKGECLTEKVLDVMLGEEKRDDYYLNHLRITNNMLLSVFDRLEQVSGRPVIFIIQADEGPFPFPYEVHREDFSFWNAPDQELRRKLGIFNAIYLPSGKYEGFAAERTPVNLFRLVFADMFGTEPELLGHRSYSFDSHELPYDFKDITDRLE